MTAVDDRLRIDELLPALDRRYQARLESINAMRRRVAQAAMLRKDIERQLTELESPSAPAGLRERLAAASEVEERLTVECQREQMRLDAFRTRKEVLKAATPSRSWRSSSRAAQTSSVSTRTARGCCRA